MSILLRIILPILILGLGYFGMKVLSVDPTEVEKEKPTSRVGRYKKSAITGQVKRLATTSAEGSAAVKTKAQLLKKTDYQVKILSEGIVTAHHLTSLTPLVNGRVVKISSAFESGGFFKKGDVLVELDSADLQSALTSAIARLAQAEASVAQEEARAIQAKLNWDDIGYKDEPSDLVLRKPQLKEARARLTSARADLEKGQRDLEHTKIRAPYAGCVKARSVGIGQSVSSNTNLGEIFSTEFAEIRFPISPHQLPLVKLPANRSQKKGQTVIIKDALGIHPDAEWSGELMRSEAVIDEASRELYLIARVTDPYQRNSMASAHSTGKGSPGTNAPLRVGQPVRISLNGHILTDVYEIPRSALSSSAEVLLIEPEEMRISRHEITTIWEDADSLIVRDQIPEGYYLATSRISRVPRGARVEIIEDKPSELSESVEKNLTLKKEEAKPVKEKG